MFVSASSLAGEDIATPELHGAAGKPLEGQRVLVIGALAESLLNFRGELIRDLICSGAKVTAMSAAADESIVEVLASMGCGYLQFPVSRTGMSPIADLRTLLALREVMRTLDPDHVIAYTIKPVIYGGLAHRLARSRGHFHALVTGLGFAFGGGSFSRRLLSGLVERLYRQALARADTVFFQNPDDLELFRDRGLVDEPRGVLLAGSGLDLDRFAQKPLPPGPPRFLMTARLLCSKGVLEYAEAARRVRQIHPDWQFDLLGPQDGSPDAVSEAELDRIAREGNVNLLGSYADVRPFLARSHVFVLPTYYPEGRPRTIQEALATGRPVVTTDMPGCRDAIEPGVNGWLVPPRDADALADRLLSLKPILADLETYAASARQFAVSRYDVKLVNRRMIQALCDAG